MKPRLGKHDRVGLPDALLRRLVIIANQLRDRLNAGGKPVIWLVGDGRSGTTWLANVINYNRQYRFLFEPFHPMLDSMAWFEPFCYLRVDSEHDHLAKTTRAIFSGRFYHERTDQFNHIRFYDGLLIKDIFTHLIMKWVEVRFPSVKQILMLRHPCAVALSKAQLKNHAIWASDMHRFLSQDTLVVDFLRQFQPVMHRAESYFQQLITTWCIIHYVPLCQIDQSRIHLVFYEESCTKPVETIKRLQAFLGDATSELDPGMLAQLGTPSQTCRQESAICSGKDLIGWWRNELPSENIRQADAILREFGLHHIYPENEIMPNRQFAESFANFAARIS